MVSASDEERRETSFVGVEERCAIGIDEIEGFLAELLAGLGETESESDVVVGVREELRCGELRVDVAVDHVSNLFWEA